MFYLDSEGNRYYLGKAFNYGDIQYAPAGATEDTFAELGFTAVTIDSRPSDRFYIVTGPDNQGQYTATPRDLNMLKEAYIREEKLSARKLLEKTDWLVIRKEENSDTIPTAVADFRDQVRTISNDNCTSINACASVEDLEILITSDYQTDDGEGNFSINPDALTQFPEEISGYDY